jgi:hypothetical protein
LGSAHIGQSLVLGGLVRIDLVSIEPHPTTTKNPHIRITSFTNLPQHITSTAKAESLFNQTPQHYKRTNSSIEVCVVRALGPEMEVAATLDVKSTGNSARNTIEIVIAGLGFVALGGNFLRAKVVVFTPRGRGVGVRRALVDRIEDVGCCLRAVKRVGKRRGERVKQGGGKRVSIA